MTPSAVSSTAAAAAVNTAQDDLVFLDEQETNNLSYWEFINPSDVDSDTESLHSLENGFVSWYALSAPPSLKTKQEIETQEATQDEDLVDDVNCCDDNVNYYQGSVGPIIFPVVDYGIEEDEEKEEEEEEEEEGEDEEEEDGYGLDDELVPWQVSGKLGRQRMRKLGKRVFAKMGNSKRNPYSFVKPGCVRGKHGLGIKA